MASRKKKKEEDSSLLDEKDPNLEVKPMKDKKEEPKVNLIVNGQKKHDFKHLIYGALVLVLLIAIVVLLTMMNAEEEAVEEVQTKEPIYKKVTEEIETTKVIEEKIPYEYSFEEFYADLEASDGLETHMTGYLQDELNGRIHTKYLVDNQSNRIKLRFNSYVYQGDDPNQYFESNKTSEEAFALHGILIKNYKSLEMDVITLEPAEGSYRIVEKTVVVRENVTRLIQVN
jgi:hypothetical protein